MTRPHFTAILALAALLAGCTPSRPPPGVQGDPERGRIVITQFACHTCHIVPGIPGPNAYVGRPLDDLDNRRYIAGKIPNSQQNLVRYLIDPQAVDPGNAMPALGLSERDAQDISAYLLSR